MKRKMSLIVIVVLVLVLLVAFVSLRSERTITMSGIIFKPYVFETNEEISGIDADIASMAIKKAGVKAAFTRDSSWAHVYEATLQGPKQALIGLTYSAERKDLFKWAGPTSKGAYVIFVKSNTGIAEAISVEKSKKLPSIAVVNKKWEETIVLEKLGFENLIYFDSYKSAVNAFMENKVKAIASDQAQFMENISAQVYKEEKVTIACTYHTAYHFIAFSKDVDGKLVKRCQKQIDALTCDGTLLKSYKKYCPNATNDMVPGIIQLHTEIDPPYNYYPELSGVHSSLIGSSVDIINAMQADNSYKNPINVGAWSIAYEALQYMPNYALFTTARTAEREEMFQWVGPISATSLRFHTKASSGLKIRSLEEAKKLGKIATPNGWFTHAFLQENGFKNILATATTSEEAINQLMSGEADALFLYETGFKWLCDEMGVKQTEVSEQFKTGHYEYYIAFSLNTPASLVGEWQDNLDALKADGRFESIWNKWYAGIPTP